MNMIDKEELDQLMKTIDEEEIPGFENGTIKISLKQMETIRKYIEDLEGQIEDLKQELEYIEDKYEDFKQDVEDNFKRKTIQEQVEYGE